VIRGDRVILSTWKCLALANQVFFDRGWGNLLAEIPRLHARPDDLEALIVIIGASEDAIQIANAAERLVLGTRHILREFQKALRSQQTARDVFGSSYPEIKDGIRKVLAACERQQPVAASVAAWFTQFELSLMLNALGSSTDHANFNLYSEFALPYRQLDFPDRMQAPSGDLFALAEQARLLDEQVRQWLQAPSMGLCEFETLEAFERSG